MSNKNNWILKLVLPVILFFSARIATGQPASVDLKKAIEMAMANNYSLKADSMNMKATAYRPKVLLADYLPQVDYSSKAEYNLAIPSQMLPGSIVGNPAKEFVPVQFGTRYNLGNSLEVSQNIIRKDLRSKMHAAVLDNSIAQTRHNLTREELVYQVAVAFYALQTNAEMIRTTTGDYLNLKEILAIAKGQTDLGTLKRIDYESLQINTANKQSYLNQLQTQYNDQLANFNYLMGIPAASPTIISGSISGALEFAEPVNRFSQREDIHLATQLIQAKEIEIKSIKAESLPAVSTYFRFNYQGQFNKPDKAFNQDYWFKGSTVGITTSIPIFDGYRRKNRVGIAQSQLQQLKFQSEQTQQLAKKEWVSATETFHKDQQQFQITRQNLVLAEKVFTARKALYSEGVTTLIELLDAERELSQSRNLHIQAMINAQTSLVNIHKAKGTLLTEFLNTI